MPVPPPPPPSLPARLYLLAWDAGRGRPAGGAHLHHLVRAGALTELAQRGLLADEDGIVTPADADARTGDRALDGLLELVAESRPRTWKSWVSLRARVTLAEVREQLTADGWLRPRRRRILGLFPKAGFEPVRTDAVAVLRADVRDVLTGPVPTAEVPKDGAALVALVAAAELRTVVSGRERRRHKERIEALAERAGAAGPALRQVIGEVRALAIVAATSGGG
ncbi:hypothetical protein GCM10018793_42650 [Streptomyces sulfonofaciens]|uniref:GPP34 family phosphoprotein n=1 Tax=Streptomyces sulfonofaciens TaxID=68272 RepID=A0A919GEM5_9ACTN|nr:GPP34 family phosphoprotein [Streptomyces sulfonofaciens]GHH82544.1 hypothetical protein GCM10018793_42650 [Streptomyces sulfonofaciens]